MIIFMGVAGSGKSLQGKLLADELGLPWLSTGEFLRMLISGERRREMLKGKLLADHEIIALVRKILAIIDSHEEFVLDGFPRTPAQADWLLNQVKHGQLKITVVLNLKATKDVIMDRLKQRGRPDDNVEAINERFKEYEGTILPILKQFKESGIKVIDIDGEKPLSEVHDEIAKAVASQH
ncbi:MAG TPA: nucleoside monophosphate kinase [Candidatus Saccharimonadales bacterium]|nr:nucleoside monophosphate kinase [Candidatus Saccharimonadales bacterium]